VFCTSIKLLEHTEQKREHQLSYMQFETLRERATADLSGLFLMNLMKIAHVVPKISSWTDRQTHTHTDVLITVLHNRSRGQSNIITSHEMLYSRSFL